MLKLENGFEDDYGMIKFYTNISKHQCSSLHPLTKLSNNFEESLFFIGLTSKDVYQFHN